jgi:glycosyltransferase involved in cell wall biosynthesis
MTAYAFGKPVVATRAGNLPEYVQDGVTGLLVPPANVEQLAEAIVRLLSDDALRRRMGENATRWMHGELSPKNIARQTLEAYEKAIRMHYSGCR